MIRFCKLYNNKNRFFIIIKNRIFFVKLFSKKFKKYPDMTRQLNTIIDAYCEWRFEKTLKLQDVFFTYGPPCESDWNCDTHNYGIDWDEAKDQMGTTYKKFSLTQFKISEKNILLYTKLFFKLKIDVIIASYATYRVGYDCEIVYFSKKEYYVKLDDYKKKEYIEYLHICLL
jgi:hypothetical protein